MYKVFIGYDSSIPKLSYTAAESLLDHSSVPLQITFLNQKNIPEYTRPRGEYDSTEFSNSRFMTPYLSRFEGWSLFMDNDIICQADIAKLFDHRNMKYSVMCCKHSQVVKDDKKFLGREQTKYSCKNWSSVILFNNTMCTNLLPDYVNAASGLDLHQFKWTSFNKIGELPLEWNYLVDNANQSCYPPKMIHYTNGGPYYEDTKDCEHADKWQHVARRLDYDVRKFTTRF